MKIIRKIVEIWPGKSLGLYRFLPLFFALGASLEFSMINWRVGTTNFYDSYKRKQAKIIVEQKLRESSAS